MAPLRPHTRPRGLLAALVLFLALVPLSPSRALPDNGALPRPGYEQRASAEKESRSRYRLLEWTSIVLILAGGGGAILWTIRRRSR
ncbi:MAG: hypothetical protein M1377_02590 [Deltaproteobacteria bacterium]|nr:hypothetical protein [Deltaproteobacteria bacterium]